MEEDKEDKEDKEDNEGISGNAYGFCSCLGSAFFMIFLMIICGVLLQ